MAAESEFDLWRVITTATAGAVLAVGRWIFGLASRQRELESWRKIVDTKLEECDAASTGTHDAVIVMQEVVANLKSDVAEIKADQKSVLKELAVLVGRAG